MQRESIPKALEGLNVRLFELGGRAVTLSTVVTAVVVIIASYLLSLLVQRAITRAVGGETGSVHVATRLIHYFIVLAGCSVALQTAGIDLRALFAAGAVFAIGIGFAMQNIAQNFVSGVILLVEHSIRPGDVLEIEGKQVRVVDMGIRTTRVRSRDDEVLIVPNATLVQSTVRSYTLLDTLCRVRVNVGVAYGNDMALVRRALETAAHGASFRSQSRDPLVLLSEFGASSVDWEVSIWIDDPWELRPLASALREVLWSEILKQGIRLAYPQLDVHLDEPVVRALGPRAA